MRHHRNEIAIRRRVDALIPQPQEILKAVLQFRPALLFGIDNAATGDSGDDIRPARKLVAVFPREVEQSGEQLGGEFDRHAIDPVESFIDGEAIQYRLRARADEDFKFGEAPA
jgi:hypothetical protein